MGVDGMGRADALIIVVFIIVAIVVFVYYALDSLGRAFLDRGVIGSGGKGAGVRHGAAPGIYGIIIIRAVFAEQVVYSFFGATE